MSWKTYPDEVPPNDTKLLVTGYENGESGRSRWYVVAIFCGDDKVFFEGESGEELCTPTHWQEIDEP